jgi:hypothetical protein
MLLLVSGASGVGKSMARVLASRLLAESNPGEFENAELFTLGPIPPVPTIAWRHEMAEVAVQRAIALEKEGRHLMFAGDQAITTDAWPEMRWERWLGNPVAAENWAMEVLDTSSMSPDAVAAAVADWAQRAVRGDAPVFKVGWFEGPR